MNLPQIKSERAFWVSAAVLFAVLIAFVYYPVFAGRVPLPSGLILQFPAWGEWPQHEWTPVADIGDLIEYFYPFNHFSAKQIQSGVFPLWNRYVMSGYPFQAEPQTALFYPLHIFYYLFSTPVAWTLALLVRMWLAAMFMTLLIRTVGGSRVGSIVAGMAFAFGGFMVSWQGTSMGDAMIWLPLMCYAVHRLYHRRSTFAVALTGFAFAMPVLAGHPETAIHLILAGCIAALWISAPRIDMRFLGAFSLAGLLAVGLAAVQLLPTLEWVQQAGRDPNMLWPSFMLHQGLGFFSRDVLRGPNSAGIFVPNSVAYIGMFTLLVAALGLLHSRRRYVIGFGLFVAVGVGGTYGFEPVHWILNHLPVVRGIKNERLILMADFGLAALAGFGMTVLEENIAAWSRVRKTTAWVLTACGFLTLLLCVHQLRLTTVLRVETLRRPSFSRTLLVVSLIFLAWKLFRGSRARLFPAAACALLAFDLLTFGFGYNGFTSRADIFPAAPVFDFLRQRDPAGTFRVSGIGGSPFLANSGISYGLEFVSGFEASVPLPLSRFVSGISVGYLASFDFVAEKLFAVRDRRLDLLNLKYFVVVTFTKEYPMFVAHPERFTEVYKRGTVAVFENKAVLPRAFLVPAEGIRIVDDASGPLPILVDAAFDPLKSVALYQQPMELPVPSGNPLAEFSGNTEITDNHVNGYRFHTQSSTPAVLVVSQNFYPGWKATVDGAPTSVFPANQAFAGIAIPAGDHDVRFVFDPLSFKVGLVISILSALVFLVMVIPGVAKVRASFSR